MKRLKSFWQRLLSRLVHLRDTDEQTSEYLYLKDYKQ